MFKRFSLLALSLLAGCGLFDGGGGEPSSYQGSAIEEDVKGHPITVLDDRGKPVPSAFILYSADYDSDGIMEEEELSRFQTTPSGQVYLPENSTVRRVLRVEAPGFLPLVKNLSKGAPLPEVLSLKKLEETGGVEVRSTPDGLTVKTSRLEVEIPAGRRALPEVSKVEVGVINPGAEPDRMPADFRGYWRGSSILSSSGAFFVRFYGPDGWPLELPEGNYRVKIKISPEDYAGLEDFNPETPEVEIPLWYLNKKEGIWERENELGYLVDGEGKKVSREELSKILAEGRRVELFVEGEVKHFSFINCDIPTRPAGISGKLVGLENCKDVYLEVVGVNWNGGQGGNRANPDCTFSLPLPYALRERQLKRKCFAAAQLGFINLLSTIKAYVDDPNSGLSEVCREKWMDIYRSLKVQAHRFKLYMTTLANSDLVDEDTARYLNELAYRYEKLFYEDRPDEARRLVEKVILDYWVANDRVSADFYLKAEQEAYRATLSAFTSALFGLPVEYMPTASDSPLQTTFGKMLYDIVEVAAQEKHACLAPIARAAAEVGTEELKSALMDLSAGKPVSFSKEKGIEVGLKFVQKFSESTIDTRKGEFKESFVKCLEQVPALSKYLSNFSEPTPFARALARNLGPITMAASGIAAGIKGYIDLAQIEGNIRRGALADRLETAAQISERGFRQAFWAFRSMDPECYPESLEPILSMFANYDEVCTESSSFARAFKEIVNSPPEESPSPLLAFKALVDGMNAVLEEASVAFAVSGAESFYDRWIDAETWQEAAPVVSGESRPDLFGGYLSALQISIPSMGIYNLPVEDITSIGVNTQVIPSPAVPAYQGAQTITAWIGEVDLSSALLTQPVEFNFKLELPPGVELKGLQRLFLKDKRGRFIPVNPTCERSDRGLKCLVNLHRGYLNSYYDVIAAFSFLYEGEAYQLTYSYGRVLLTSSLEFPVRIYRCESPKIKSFNPPAVIRPAEEVRASARVEFVPYLSSSACTGQEPVFRWYLSGAEVGTSKELHFRAPDKLTLAQMGRELYLSFEVSVGDRRASRGAWVRVEIPNSPPQVVELRAPEKIPWSEEEFYAEVIASDPDGDGLSFRWFAFPYGSLAVKEGMGARRALISASHGSSEVSGRLCVEVSDGLERAVKCSEVVVEERAYPPEVLKVSYSAGRLSAPAEFFFRAEVLSVNPLEELQVSVEGPISKTYTFKEPDFSLKFEEEGLYRVKVVAVDRRGLKSEPYSLSVFVLPPAGVSLKPYGSVVSYEPEEGRVKLEFQLLGASELEVIRYLWDLDGDGLFETVTFEPELELALTLQEVERLKELSVRVETTRGYYQSSLSVEEIEPFVSLNLEPQEGYAPLEVTFEVLAYAPSAAVESYSYDFDGDGEIELTSEKPLATFIYTGPGVYSPTVRVRFSDGREAVAGGVVKVSSTGTLTFYRALDNATLTLKGVALRGPESLFLFSYSTASWEGFILADFELSSGFTLTGSRLLTFPRIDGSLEALPSGYLGLFWGNICLSQECTEKPYAVCALNFGKWHSCFRHSYYAISFKRAAELDGTVYLYTPGRPEIALLSGADGAFLGVKVFKYGGKWFLIDYIWPGRDALFLLGSVGEDEFLVKVNPQTLSVVYARGFRYADGYSKKPYFEAAVGDDEYLFAVFSKTYRMTRHGNILFKFRLRDGELLKAQEVLYRCPYYCIHVVDAKKDGDYLYLLGSYGFWGNPEQYVIKMKTNGELAFVSRMELCQKNNCSNPALRLVVVGQELYALGAYRDEDGLNGVYGFSLSKESGLGCSDYVSPGDGEEVDFGGDVEVELSSPSPSEFTFEDMDGWQEVEAYFTISEVPPPFELYLNCR